MYARLMSVAIEKVRKYINVAIYFVVYTVLCVCVAHTETGDAASKNRMVLEASTSSS